IHSSPPLQFFQFPRTRIEMPSRGGILPIGTVRGPVPPVVVIALPVTYKVRDSTIAHQSSRDARK
ncbi:hypothetical protein J6590_092732, partial [Homalodisca vitripennis]